jgi:hypothetical protein
VLPKFILEPSFAKSGDEKKVRMNRVPQFCTGDEIKSQDERKRARGGGGGGGGGQSGFLT